MRFCVVTADGTRGFAANCTKDCHHKRFKMAQVNHKQIIFTKTYHFRGRLWGKSYKTILPGTQQMDGSWKRLKKRRPMSMLQKKSINQQVYQKKTHLGLQLDMGPQRSLVAICGFCVATRALAQRSGTERRQEEKTGRVNVALILKPFWLKAQGRVPLGGRAGRPGLGRA